MYTEQQRIDDAKTIVKSMETEKKDSLFKQIVGEKRFEVLKLSEKYAQIRDDRIISYLFQYSYGNEKMSLEERLIGLRKELNKVDLNKRYRGFAVKGLEKFPAVKQYILDMTGELELDPNEMEFYGNQKGGLSRMYVYRGRFGVIFDNSPMRVYIQDFATGQLLGTTD